MVFREFNWLSKEKTGYNRDACKKEKLQFLRMYYINEYNNSMGNVDVRNQLRKNYRFDH